ncbi:hypothetical protein FRB91_003435 [Serendipita sp. 411]|nr:hypothetical protein FRB91_003435 [Serendipita sp. 411]
MPRAPVEPMSTTISFPTDNLKLSPLLINPRSGEPYLQLPAPHENIIITPFRPEDVDSMVKFMNDERVYSFLGGPPFPYTHEDGVMWSKSVMERSQSLFRCMEDGNQFLDGCPVSSIREVYEDGSDVYIGDITIGRETPERTWVGPEDVDNLKKPVGDPTILYTVGGMSQLFRFFGLEKRNLKSLQDYLAPTHHRRGIMSTALRTIIDKWAIPRMNCQRITATAFVGNVASVGVFKKVRFEHVRDVSDAMNLPSGRGGHLMSVHLLEWVCK